MVRDPPSVYCRGHRPVAAHRHYRSGAMDCACIEGVVPRSEYAHRQRHKAAVLMPAISCVEQFIPPESVRILARAEIETWT